MKLTEKQKHCPYCQSYDSKPINDDGFDNHIIVFSDGTIGMEFEGGCDYSAPNTIKYCPMCGRRLGSDIDDNQND